MAKQIKTQLSATSNQIYQVGKKGIKIYPVYSNVWQIEVNEKGKITRFEKTIQQNEINETLAKTVIHYFEKLKQ